MSSSGMAAGQDEQVPVLLLPERVDDRRHELQHAAGPLEPLERRPVVEEPVEQLGVDRVAGPQALEVRLLLRLGREAALVLGVQLAEPLDDLVAALDRLGRQRLEEAPPDDLEATPGRPPAATARRPGGRRA